MLIKWLNDKDARPTNEPLMAAISFDESVAYVSLLDDGVEHSVLLRKMLGSDAPIERCYRIIIDSDGADWTFVCPANYKNITNKEHRIKTFYKEGFDAITNFLKEIDYPVEVNIPKRYRRHYDYMINDEL